MNDTIVAISTTVGVGAISIIRLTGKDSIEIVNNNFKGKNLNGVDSHTINYGHIIYNNEMIDEVLVSIMKAPKTFTTENVVEINCHGGISTTNKILEIMLLAGARLATPGEFTKRAFLNGRIDLVESESVIDLINSKNNEQRQMALSNLNKTLSNLINNFRNNLKDLLSQIEVNNDYPEYDDIEVVTKEKLETSILEMKQKLNELIKESENITYIKEGIKTVIIGKPNVGKSSILNKLIEKDKAIVTDIPGTTRDIVEGEIQLDGIFLNIIDTAGIRETDDLVEKIGVKKSVNLIEEADLVILVLNQNENLTTEDLKILEKSKNKSRIIVLNKDDLEEKIDITKLNSKEIVKTNTNSIEGIVSLKNKIKELYNTEKLQVKDYTYLSNSRQIALAKKALINMNDAQQSLNDNIPIDMVAIDLKDCFENLGEIIGATYSNEIIDNLFKNFCVGK